MSVADAIQLLLAGDSPMSDVLEAVKSGDLKHEEVTAYFKELYRPTILSKVQAFARGKLFKAQSEEFDSWLKCGNWAADQQAWFDFKSDVDMGQRKIDEPDFKDIMRFAGSRVMTPSLADRLEILDAKGSYDYDSALERWSNTNRKEGWQWNRVG